MQSLFGLTKNLLIQKTNVPAWPKKLMNCLFSFFFSVALLFHIFNCPSIAVCFGQMNYLLFLLSQVHQSSKSHFLFLVKLSISSLTGLFASSSSFFCFNSELNLEEAFFMEFLRSLSIFTFSTPPLLNMIVNHSESNHRLLLEVIWHDFAVCTKPSFHSGLAVWQNKKALY